MENPASAPILLLDSGVGGLTVLEQVRRLLPDAPIIYAADTAGLPYGEKSEAEIAARVAGLLGRMTERYRPRLVTIACNTASTIALGMVRDVLNIPIVGTVPAIKPAAERSQTGVIGLLGTAATIRQRYVDRLEAEFASDKTLIRFAAPELVKAAEMVLRGEQPESAIFTRVAEGLRSQPRGDEIDTVVLACTHFPLVAKHLGQELGQNVQFVDGAAGIARRVASLTKGQEFIRNTPDFALYTGHADSFNGLSQTLSRYGINHSYPF